MYKINILFIKIKVQRRKQKKNRRALHVYFRAQDRFGVVFQHQFLVNLILHGTRDVIANKINLVQFFHR